MSKFLVRLFFLLCSIFHTNAQDSCLDIFNPTGDVLFSKPFDNYNSWAQSGSTSYNCNGIAIPWNAQTFGNCGAPGLNGTDYLWGVNDGVFEIADVEGFNCCDCLSSFPGFADCGDARSVITFGPIDISNHRISLQFGWFKYTRNVPNNLGSLGCSAVTTCSGILGGQLIVEFVIDGVSYNPMKIIGDSEFQFLINPTCTEDPRCITGNELVVNLYTGTQSISEIYTIEDLTIHGIPLSMAETECAFPLSAETSENSNEIKLFPNPTSSNLQIESAAGFDNVKVFSLEGRLFLELFEQGHSNIDLSSLEAGVYIVELMNEDGLLVRQKVVKQ